MAAQRGRTPAESECRIPKLSSASATPASYFEMTFNAVAHRAYSWGSPGLLGPVIYFDHDGLQRIRIQVREDGLGIDQIPLSSERWLSVAPGLSKDDTTILAKQN